MAKPGPKPGSKRKPKEGMQRFKLIPDPPPKPIAGLQYLRIVVDNMREKNTYTRLLDPGWSKDHLDIYAGDMDDPTIGHRQDLAEQISDLIAKTEDELLKVKELYIWSPALMQHLDLFTIHCYEDLGEPAFQNLLVFFLRPDIYQVQPNVLHWPEEFLMGVNTRFSFVMPGFTKMFMDIGYTLK